MIEGQKSTESPDGLYSSVWIRSEYPIGKVRRQVIGATDSFTVFRITTETNFIVEFYRTGAMESAARFRDWTMTESGITWAATAITDGRIQGANVYDGGTGYSTGEKFQMTPKNSDLIDVSELSSGYIVANDRGEMTQAIVTNFGIGYTKMPIPDIKSSGTGASVSPRGFGFSVKTPIRITVITNEQSNDWEERAQIDLKIAHDHLVYDRESGRVETIIGDRNFQGI